MQNLQKLKEIIHKEVPEIMELKFGCKVLVTIDDEYREENIVSKMGVNEIGIEVECEFYDVEAIKDCDFIEVLGRDITLADVLRAIYCTWGARTVKIDEYGYAVFKQREVDLIMKVLQRWKISENLDGQPQPTINFLLEILTNK